MCDTQLLLLSLGSDTRYLPEYLFEKLPAIYGGLRTSTICLRWQNLATLSVYTSKIVVHTETEADLRTIKDVDHLPLSLKDTGMLDIMHVLLA